MYLIKNQLFIKKYLEKKLYFVLAIITVLLIPNTHYAQSPNLGSVANFVLFTTFGAVTNTSISQLTGNVGSNSSSGTGFVNVKVNGVKYNNLGCCIGEYQ